MRGRKRPLTERAKAVGIAVVAGSGEASRQTGIPEPTIYAWMQRPEFKELQERTKDEMVNEWRAGAQVAFRRAVELVAHSDDPVKAATTGAIIFDKAQIASGGVTERSEVRDLTSVLNDHELDLLRTAIQRETAAQPAEEVAVAGAGEGRTAPA